MKKALILLLIGGAWFYYYQYSFPRLVRQTAVQTVTLSYPDFTKYIKLKMIKEVILRGDKSISGKLNNGSVFMVTGAEAGPATIELLKKNKVPFSESRSRPVGKGFWISIGLFLVAVWALSMKRYIEIQGR